MLFPEDFIRGAYGKEQLALMYFPQCTPRTARRNLTRAMQRIPALMADLQALGYRPTTKLLLPAMVDAVLQYLGPPAVYPGEGEGAR